MPGNKSNMWWTWPYHQKKKKAYKMLFRKSKEMKEDPSIPCEWIRGLNIVETSVFSNGFIDQIKCQ